MTTKQHQNARLSLPPPHVGSRGGSSGGVGDSMNAAPTLQSTANERSSRSGGGMVSGVLNNISNGIASKKSFFKSFISRGGSKTNEQGKGDSMIGKGTNHLKYANNAMMLSNQRDRDSKSIRSNEGNYNKGIIKGDFDASKDQSRAYSVANRGFGKDITNKVLNSSGAAVIQHGNKAGLTKSGTAGAQGFAMSQNNKQRASMSSVNASRKPSPSVHSMGQQPTKFTNQVPHVSINIRFFEIEIRHIFSSENYYDNASSSSKLYLTLFFEFIQKTTRITRDSNETKSVTNNSQRGMSNESDFNRTNLNSRLHDTNHAPVIKSSTKSQNGVRSMEHNRTSYGVTSKGSGIGQGSSLVHSTDFAPKDFGAGVGSLSGDESQETNWKSSGVYVKRSK